MTTTTPTDGASSPSGSTTVLLRPSDVDPRELAKKALEIAEASPDFIYSRHDSFGAACVYVEPDTLEGSCLFGRAFLALGVDPEALLPINMHGVEDVLGFARDENGADELGNAQGCQDVGIPWGAAPREHLLAFLNREPA